MAMTPIPILIVDDSEIIRKALRHLLSQQPERWAICGEASDGVQALAKVALHLPKVVFLDLSIPGMSGLDVAKEMKIKFPGLVIVLMSEQDPSALRHLAEHFGFRYSLPKSHLVKEFLPMLATIEKERAEVLKS